MAVDQIFQCVSLLQKKGYLCINNRIISIFTQLINETTISSFPLWAAKQLILRDIELFSQWKLSDSHECAIEIMQLKALDEIAIVMWTREPLLQQTFEIIFDISTGCGIKVN